MSFTMMNYDEVLEDVKEQKRVCVHFDQIQ